MHGVAKTTCCYTVARTTKLIFDAILRPVIFGGVKHYTKLIA